MRWYKIAKNFNKSGNREALRRNDLHVDLRVYVGEPTDFSNENDMISKIKSVIVAAINKSLDVIGIVTKSGCEIGFKARQIAKDSEYDLWICPGQEYVCADKISIVAYNLQKNLQQGLMYEQAVAEVRKQNGFVLAMQLSKRASQQLEKYSGTPMAPDAVEIANDKQGGYKDLNITYPKFENSASTNANELEKSYTFTIISRKDFEKMNLMPPGEGSDYVPEYLEQDDIENPNPQISPEPTTEPTIDTIENPNIQSSQPIG